jgi:hypothetical protein
MFFGGKADHAPSHLLRAEKLRVFRLHKRFGAKAAKIRAH